MEWVALVVSACLALISATALAWMLHAWWEPDAPTVPRRVASNTLSFSLLAPARHEETVFGATLDRLAALDHEDYEVLAIVGHDDPGTTAVAEAASRRHPGRIRVIVDNSVPKSKPKALNTALPYCRGDVIGIFDAEDVVHEGLLAAVEHRFVTEDVSAVQAGVQLINFWSTWFSCHNALEYYFWFRSRLGYQASTGMIPLGGNTVFFKRDVVNELGGWDDDCLAEDCEIGIRLSSEGHRVSVMYDPDLVTREEAPVTVSEFVRQRTRWDQGFLQVLLKGYWMKLPSLRLRMWTLFTLSTPLLSALVGLTIPFTLLGIFVLKLPDAFVLATFVPLVPVLATVGVQWVGLVDLGKIAGRRPRLRDFARIALGTPAFSLMLGWAAIRAVGRQARGSISWEKTAHTGLHLHGVTSLEEAA
jgi:glycosyltransferase XagB